MISKKLIAAVGAGAIAGGLGVTLAGGTVTAGAATTATHAKGTVKHGHHFRGARLGGFGGVLHGQGVVKTKTGFATEDFARGTVSAVTPTTITITSADKVATTFTSVAGDKIRLDGKSVSLSAAKIGDKAGALATKSGSALNLKTLVLRDAAAKKAAPASTTGA